MVHDGSADPVTKQYKFQGLNAGSRYQYRVNSRNAIGYSLAPSDVLEVYAATYPYKMDPVVRGTVTPAGSSSSIEVTWSDNPYDGGSPVLGYYLQHNNGYESSFVEPGTQIAFGVNSYTVTDLLEGVTYKFRIAAYNILEAANSFPVDELNFSEAMSTAAANEPDQITVFRQSTVDYVSG